MSAASSIIALDLGSLSFGPTPVAMLLAVVFVAAVLVVLVVVASLAAGTLVDRRWPANQPLTPSEVLWGESSGYVKKHFPGLDPMIARDLSQYISTSKVGVGETLIERGDLPSHFVMLKSGAAEAVSDSGTTPIAAGGSIGGDNIMRRMPFDVMVRTTAPSEVVRVPAEDYLAAIALGMSDDDDDDIVKILGSYFSEPLAAPAPGVAAAESMPVVAQGWQRQWSEATHRVGAAELPGYILPAGDTPTRTLPHGHEVRNLEGLPGWAHVRTADGWQGWVVESGLTDQ